MKKVILFLSLSLLCLLTAVEKNAFDFQQYIETYSNYNVVEITGKNLEELGQITKDLLDYLKGEVDIQVLESNFNIKEIWHMKDVRGLFRRGFVLKYICIILSTSIIILFIVKSEKNILGMFLYKSLFINWILVGVIAIMIYFDFSKYFTYFHYVFFRNNLWQLDPQRDLLIQLFPEEFFINITTNIILSFLSFMAIIQTIGYLITRERWLENEKSFKLFKRKS